MSANPEDQDDEPVILMDSSSENRKDDVEESSSNVITLSDDSSIDSVPSPSTMPPPTRRDTAPCTKCQQAANLTLFKQKVSTSGGKQEDIFKHYCDFCKDFFGMCSKKVRGTFVNVTEEGRILTKAEKMEFQEAGERKRSLSQGVNEEIVAEEASDTSTNGNISNDNEKEEEEDVKEEDEEDESEKAKDSKKKRKPQKKTAVFGGKRPKTNWSNRSKLKRKQAEKEEREALGVEIPKVVKVSRTAAATAARKKKAEERRGLAGTEEKRQRGRPPLNRSTATASTSSEQKPSTSSSIDRQRSIPLMHQMIRTRDTCDSGAQTDPDMLLKSTYLSDVFDESMKRVLGDQIASRLQGQPMILKKTFMVMQRTIQVQETELQSIRATKQQYTMAVEQMRNFGRTTRLAYSDDLRMIRADMVERKEEFRTHQAEVLSIMKRQKEKYEGYKRDMNQKYEDQKLEVANLEAKLAFCEQEKQYEFDRAEFYLRKSDVSEMERNEAVSKAKTAVKNLNDRIWIANNERCTHCQTVEKVRTKMKDEVAGMTEELKKAVADRNQALEKATLFESAAQKLGKDCDSIKYERDSWKAYAQKFQKDMNKLSQTLKEKEKELLEKNEALATTPKHIITPRSVGCTPSDADRVSPPEDGEILDTPPQASPSGPSTSKTPAKLLIQKVIEKNSTPIAAGFASWIPKDKIDAPAPSIPKAQSAFGPPIKTPQQREAERAKLVIPLQSTPWERANMPVAASDSLSEALSKVQAEAFLGGAAAANKPAFLSKSYTEEIHKLQQAARKRASDEAETEEQKKAANSSPAPPTKKQKNTTSSYKTIAPATPGPSSVGSLSNMKKIPKLSEKPPQAEFAPALGIRDENGDGGIPGLSAVRKETSETSESSEKPVEPEKLGKILPATPVDPPKPTPAANPKQAPKQTPAKPPITPSPSSSASQNSNKGQNQITTTPKNKKKKKKNGGGQWEHPKQDPWDNAPMNSGWKSGFQGSYGIQPSSSQQNRYAGYDGPWSDQPGYSRPADNESSSFSALPWHRNQVKTQDTPFGKVPIQDTSFGIGGPPLNYPGPQSFYGGPNGGGGGGFYNSSSQQQQRYPGMYPPPPNRPRSFYD